MSKISTFTAVDFETACHSRTSICQVGLVRVENFRIKEKIELLIKPPGNEYHFIHKGIHGIRESMTAKSPTFKKVWPTISAFFENQDVVAHNSSFDFTCLKRTLEYYRITPPTFREHCTLKLFGKKLDVLCEEYEFELNHHNALSDAVACAKLFILSQNNFVSKNYSF